MAKLMEKRTFVRSGEGAVASYNWTDLAQGVGYGTFYLLMYGDSTSTTNISLVDFVSTGANSNNLTVDGVKNFDTNVFSFPRTLKGFVVFEGMVSSGAAGRRLTAQLYKVSGGVETAITDLKSTVDNTTARFYLKLTLTSTQINLKAGDFLRLKLNFSGANVVVGVDPLGSDYSGVDSQSKLLVPFKIDI